MALQRLGLIVCLLSLASPTFAAPVPGPLTWKVLGSVVAGSNMNVIVEDAPSLPVRVEITVGGRLIWSELVTELPAIVTAFVPAGTSGDHWAVTVSSGTITQIQTGIVY
jgi:hypothetical protein